eukprot:XP_001707688.1 Hypothetical protein GL50803_27318 [Giardia lamblia ATCC 50803]
MSRPLLPEVLSVVLHTGFVHTKVSSGAMLLHTAVRGPKNQPCHN